MDTEILTWLNGFAGQSVARDLIVDFIQGSYYVKGLFAVAILLFLFHRTTSDTVKRRHDVFTTLAIVFLVVFTARILQMFLPFSPRPLHAEWMDAAVAHGIDKSVLSTDSSFPSDHAVMYFAIAVSVLRYSVYAGVLLLLHATLIICLPRIYLGFHWPSDIVAGAMIGAILALLLHQPIVRLMARFDIDGLRRKYPSAFNVFFFIILAETATMYQGGRHLMSAVGEFVKLI